MRANTAAGTVEGLERDGVLQFRDIPYAAPTGGAGRFRPPQPVEPWDGVRDARDYRTIAPQNASPLESMLGAKEREQSEDCLSLTVTTPSLDGARPVMVWIHGGAFTAGAGSTPWYDGRRLAGRGDVVVVTINYRLGALGYLAVDSLAGGDYTGAGNAGLLDQVTALRWVRENIASFGGDPESVLVFGESAGGMSTAVLLATPAASGLFHAAAPQSGACDHVSTREQAAEVAEAVLRHLGATDPEALLDAPVEKLLAAQQAASAEVMLGDLVAPRLPFQPVVDGTVLPQHPLDAIRTGAAASIPLLTGTTAEEWAMFHLLARSEGPMDRARLLRRADRVLAGRFGPGSGARVVEAYEEERPGSSADDVWIAMCTDLVFRMPMLSLVEAHAPHAPGTWVYRFSHRSPAFGGVLGACHAIEIPFVFDVVHRRGVEMFLGPVGEQEQGLAAATSGAWTAFARHHDPSHEGLPPWPAHDLDRRPVMDLGPDTRVLDDPHAATRRLWAELRDARPVTDAVAGHQSS
jgi:para-nitrobenzyl esterase